MPWGGVLVPYEAARDHGCTLLYEGLRAGAVGGNVTSRRRAIGVGLIVTAALQGHVWDDVYKRWNK